MKFSSIALVSAIFAQHLTTSTCSSYHSSEEQQTPSEGMEDRLLKPKSSKRSKSSKSSKRSKSSKSCKSCTEAKQTASLDAPFILCTDPECVAESDPLPNGAILSAGLDITEAFGNDIEIRLPEARMLLNQASFLRRQSIPYDDRVALLRGASAESARRLQTTPNIPTIEGIFVGSASITEGHQQSMDQPFAHFSYVIDSSGSTHGACDDTRNIFQCEKEAIIELNSRMATELDVALGISIIDFDSNARALVFPSDPNNAGGNRHFVDPHLDNVIQDALNSGSVAGGGTKFDKALEMAYTIAEEAQIEWPTSLQASFVLFLSDGYDGATNITPAVEKLSLMGVRVFSFAIGTGSSCTGNLLNMATDTGGECSEVVDPAQLQDALLETVFEQRTLDGVELFINGEPLACSSHPNLEDGSLLPEQCPTKVTATPTQIELFGSYELCIEAKSKESTAGCCVQFNYTEP